MHVTIMARLAAQHQSTCREIVYLFSMSSSGSLQILMLLPGSTDACHDQGRAHAAPEHELCDNFDLMCISPQRISELPMDGVFKCSTT